MIAGGVVLLGVVVVLNLKRQSGKSVTVQTEKVKLETIVQTVSASGRVKPITEVNISANVSGKILALGAEEGQSVEQGQLLVALDSTRYVASVKQMRALFRSALAESQLGLANYKLAQSNLKRQKELYDKGLMSKADYESADANLEVAKARYESSLESVSQAQARLEQSLDDLSKTKIYAPAGGTVIKLNKEVGEIALGSQFQEDIIMTIADLSSMEVLVEVDENDVVLLEMADTTDIEIDAFPEKIFAGIVSEIANSAITRGRGTQEQVTNFEVAISLLELPENVRPGMSATVDIRTAVSDSAVAIPIQAVTVREPKKLQREETDENPGDDADSEVEENGNSGENSGQEEEMVEVVFVVKDDVAEMRRVKTGISSDTMIEILEGLDPEEVIVIGSYRILSKTLKDGDQVKIEDKKNGDRKDKEEG